MDNIVFYFSGTGNSLSVAKNLVKELGNGEIISMAKSEKYRLEKRYDTVGFVYPVYHWGLPKIVMDFVENTNFNNRIGYCYAIATYGGIIGNGISQIKELLEVHDIKLNYGRKLRMVANCIVSYDRFNNVSKCLKRADRKLLVMIQDIKNRKENKVGRPNKRIGKMHANTIQKMSLAKDYNVNSDCVGCGICKEVCPMKNIEIINKRPIFHSNCACCLACLQYCPQKAINYKDKTQKRKRYTNPEISYKVLSEYNKGCWA
jgi:Pyruvate/2-oxoacid:ferredoxin oxidoreductase delta subunit